MVPGDQAERERAIASPRNLAVTAGAGTGKTTLLVDKYLHKVLEEGVPIAGILALTFTEKATNEMRKRIREKLAQRGRDGGLDQAEIGTIHSFCTHVLREFPVEAGVVPDFEVDEGAVFRRRFDRAWPRWLDRELGEAARRPRAWRSVLEKVDLATMRDLAWGLSSFAVPEERGDGEATLRAFAAEIGREAPELLPALQGKGPAPRLPSKAAAFLKSAHKLAEDVAAMDPALVRRAVELAESFAGPFRRDYLAAGYVSYDAMLALVYRLFTNSEFPDVLELLREKYRYILVDEFQDTDPVQGEIIRRLAEGPDDKLVPGKLFLVGDPKQSIYSFRGADIVAYQRFVDRILREGGERVVLRTNFRSHGKLLDLVNAVFSRVLVPRRELQPPYEPIEPCPGRAPAFAGPSLEAIVIEDAKAGESRELEAELVARWIEDHRPAVPYRDVAVLFRALSDVPVYLEALRARGIPYAVQGEKYFYGTSEVIDFVNLLRAVANPHDRIALAAVLRSAFGGLSDQELYERRKALDYRTGSDVPLFGFLRRWHERSGSVGVRELIDVIFEESYALEIAQAGYHGEQAVANLLKLRQKASELEAQGGCTLREFLAAANQAVRDQEEEGESPLADETLDAVQILSIHSAKGLEFPVVILPDLHRGARGSDPRAVRYDWPSRTLGVRLGKACDAGGAALAYLDRERKREEWKRLLYVAVTRAEEALVLLGSAKHGPESYLALLLPELEGRARVTRVPYRRPSFSAPPPAPHPERPDWDGFVARWRERERRARVAEPLVSPTRLEADESDRLFRQDPDEKDSHFRQGVGEGRAVEVGVACHRVLEGLDFAAPAVPEGTDPEAAEILERFFRSAAFRDLAASEILARELPFFIPRDGGIVQGVIDVVFRRGGILYVGDYKTDKMIEPAEYRLIRDVYSEAARRVFQVEPRFTLIYLRHGRAVDVPVPERGEA
jgi:ATP-dependent helicase/nuclease subunit A